MKRLFISLAILAGISLSSCNDSFLEKTPVTDLTENNAFNSYDNFKAFMWPCYEMFTNNTIRTSLQGFGQDGQYKGDMAAGYFQQKYESGYNEFAYQTVASVASGNGWDFKSFIRRVNIMLSHIDNSSMTEAQKDHWRAVGYFFHSFWYMELIDRFGDVPWVDQVLQEDSPEAYGPRVDRKTVADKVLERLQWAEQNIGNFTSQDGDNTINQDCVRAVISRFGLREGTWRKYHELGDAEKYLHHGRDQQFQASCVGALVFHPEGRGSGHQLRHVPAGGPNGALSAGKRHERAADGQCEPVCEDRLLPVLRRTDGAGRAGRAVSALRAAEKEAAGRGTVRPGDEKAPAPAAPGRWHRHQLHRRGGARYLHRHLAQKPGHAAVSLPGEGAGRGGGQGDCRGHSPAGSDAGGRGADRGPGRRQHGGLMALQRGDRGPGDRSVSDAGGQRRRP